MELNRIRIFTATAIPAMIAASALTSCDDDKVLTMGMPESIPVSNITLDVSFELPLAVGMDTTITYSIAPAEARDKTLQWRSSNELVATVSPDGVISALAVGRTTISVTPAVGFGCEDAARSISVQVIPEIVKVTHLSFTNTVNEIYEGDRLQLETELLPANHTYSHLYWTSSDNSIATVDANGLVTGISAGTVDITAATHDGSGVKNTCRITVKRSVAAEDVNILPYDTPLYFMQPLQLSFTTTPEDATRATIDWTSDDETILSVDQSGLVRARNFGSATITATCTATGKSSSITLSVDPGYFIWDHTNDFEQWTINSNLGSIAHVDGMLSCKVTDDANARIYLQRAYSTAMNLIDLNFNKYPIIAFLADDTLNGAAVAINLANIGNTLNVSKNMTRQLTGDGHVLYYHDASESAALSNEAGLVPTRAFMFKITKSPTPTFNIQWIRVFESIDQMNAYITE